MSIEMIVCAGLPEEVVNYVDHFAGIYVHQHYVVIIPDPAIGAVNIRKTIAPWIIDPIPVAVEQIVQIEPDIHSAVAIVAIRRIITT